MEVPTYSVLSEQQWQECLKNRKRNAAHSRHADGTPKNLSANFDLLRGA